MGKYVIYIAIFLLPNRILAANNLVKGQTQLGGLGSFGDSGIINCSNCSANSIPQGYYPISGMGSSWKGNESSDSSKKGIIGSTTALVTKLIDHIPDKNLKGGLQEYMKIVNPDSYQSSDEEVGSHNAGLSRYFSRQFKENQCFQNAAVNFYKDVASILKKKNSCQTDRLDEIAELQEQLTSESSKEEKKFLKLQIKELMKNGDNSEATESQIYGCFKNRPSIDDHVGMGSKSYLDEGWLLRLAMKHSNGNPEAALEFIGMCGHDDVMQGIYTYFDDSEAAKKKNAEQLSMLKEQKKQLDENLQKAFKKFNDTDDDKNLVYKLGQQGSFLSQQIGFISSQENIGRNKNMQCPPQVSDFFLSGSLSRKADISSSLISKIKKTSGIEAKNSQTIPAKHYHVYGSAFLGCKMVLGGMSHDQAVTVQKQAARLYRGIRMCQAESEMLQEREEMQKRLGIKNFDSIEIENKVTKLWESKLKGEFKCKDVFDIGTIGQKLQYGQKKSPTNISSSMDDKQKCFTLSAFGIMDLDKSEKQVVTKKIIKKLERVDAAKLYNDWYFGGGSIAGTQLPCSDIRYKGPKDLMNPNEGIMGKVFKPAGWTDDRYNAATKKLATFDLDFEWTVAQHEAGSSYGAKLCSENKVKRNPFKEKSCMEKKSNFNPNLDNSFGFPAGVPNGMMTPGVK